MRKPKALWTAQEGGENIVRYHASDEHDEAAWVALRCASSPSRVMPIADIAVFYRTNAQSRVLEEAFNAASLPYRVVGGVGFYDRKEIKDMMAWLRAAMNPLDTISAERICGAPKRGIGPGSISKVRAFAASARHATRQRVRSAEEIDGITKKARGGALEIGRILQHIRELDQSGVPIADIVASTWEMTGYMAELQAERSFESLSRQENLKELAGSAAEYDENTEQGSLTDFLERIALVNDTDEEEGEETGVTFMTMHNAKGLEFPIVFIAGYGGGRLSARAFARRSRTARGGAATLLRRNHPRPGTALSVERVAAEAVGAGRELQRPSRFLKEIPDDLITEADKEGPHDDPPVLGRQAEGCRGAGPTPASSWGPRSNTTAGGGGSSSTCARVRSAWRPRSTSRTWARTSAWT